MTTTSQNGWIAGATKALAGVVDTVLGGTGVSFPGGLRSGDAGTVLLHVAQQLHLRVEPGVPGWCWGWSYRAVRGASSLSNHASGTAFDWNAPRHPLAKQGTFNPGQVAAIRAILAEVDHVVRWGGDYDGRKDEMHFELVGAPNAVTRIARRLREHQAAVAAASDTPQPQQPIAKSAEVAVVGGASSDGMLRPGSKGPEVVGWQGELWRIGIGVGEHDGLFGPGVEGGTLDLQRAAGPGVADDGIVGPQARDAARAVPTYPKVPGPGLPLCQPGGAEATGHAFQQRLRDRGWTITVDGKPGQQTTDVVRRFQDEANARGYLVGRADGVGGPCTWIALHLMPVTR